MRQDGGKKTIEVGDRRYQSTMYLTSKMCRIYAKLQRLVLRPIGEIAAAVAKGPGGLLDADIDATSIGAALERLATDLDPATFTELVKEILSETRGENGVPFMFEEEFQGDMLGLLKLCKEVLEHNYGDFFAVALSGYQKIQVLGKGARKDTTRDRSTSNGPSGGASRPKSQPSRK